MMTVNVFIRRNMERHVADHFEMTARDNRRNEPRKRARIRAWADPGGVAPVVDCVIVDVSKDGARIASVSGTPLPSSFTLADGAKSEIGAATVMWREGNEVGVKFERPKEGPKRYLP
jgi:PilZ domain